MPLTDAQLEQRRAAGRARARQFDSAFQRAARRKVKPQSLSASGRKGAQVTIERHGMETLFEAARQYRLAHPSPLELQVIGILSTLKVRYEREWIVCARQFLTADFYLPEYNMVIEVHGAIHDPGKPNYRRRMQNDTLKRKLLKQQHNRLLVLHHSEFANLANVIERIRREVEI